ncbi:MAG TPA: trigger factor family protein [Candidatus Woesebacteria bacterium]|nr:trigger factor family protein [Candidatus Woesebacteria bacterium]HRT40206.1 trigger factor family protein [Candidatus Woesebacteria bacterium]
MKTNPNLEKLEDKSFLLKATISQDKIKAARQQALVKIQSTFKTEGFRPGKAPIEVVEQKVNPQTLLEKVIQTVLTENYADEIKKNDLHPIIDPEVKITTSPLDYDHNWEVEYRSCELPEVKIDAVAFEEIKKLDGERKIDQIFDLLIKHAVILLPERLKEQEKDWKINLIIDKIAADQKLEVTTEEIRKTLEVNPQLAQNINLTFYLMRQQKVLDYLKNLK